MSTKVWKKRLSAFVASLLCVSCLFSSFPAGAVDFSAQKAALTNLALGCSYESDISASPDYPDDNKDKLTDGVVASADYKDSNWVGFHYSGVIDNTDIIVDLGEARLISVLEIDALNAEGVGITYPRYVAFSYSEDNIRWSEPVQVETPASPEADEVHTYSYTLDVPETARYVKITHSIDWWTFFTEIRVWGEQIIEQNPNNIVYGLPYTTSLREEDFHRDHPDAQRERLTDGVKAIRPIWKDSGTVGFHTPNDEAIADKSIDLTFDLGGLKEFQQIQFSAFKEEAENIYHPSAILIEYKDADGVWQEAFEGNMPVFDTAKGDFVFVVPDGEFIAAQAVRLTLTAGSADSWLFIDEVEILSEADGTPANINPPIGTSAKPPIITTDLPGLKSALIGETVTFRVTAKSVDGGILSYQWYRNGEALEGKTGNELILNEVSAADSGRYYVEITNNLNGEATVKQSAFCVLTVSDEPVEQLENLIAGKPYVTSLKDDQFHSSSPDKERKQLTDGIRGQSWGDGNTVGYFVPRGRIADIAFHLDGPITFSEIQIGAVSDSPAGISLPHYVKIEAKNGVGSYKVIYEGTPSGNEAKRVFTYGTGFNSKITATDLRFSFKSEGSASWIFLDEIEVFAGNTGAPLDGDLVMEENEANENLVLGKSYESTLEANSSYPDTNFELTDGRRGTTSYSDDEWQAYLNQTPEFIFDLGEVKSFEEVKVGFCQDLAAGIKLPKRVNIYSSDDKESWKLVSENGVGTNATSQMSYDLRATMSRPETARYVKISIEPNGWVFLDEVEILKNYSAIVTDKANNLAYKKVYTSNPAASAEYPDTFAITKLTDGQCATANYQNPAWVGYGISSKDTEIVIDLGTVASFEQVEATFLNDVLNGFKAPATMRVYHSLDRQNWQEAAPVNAIAPFSNAPTVCFIQSVVGASAARYVKVVFPATTKVMVDEIKVLKNRTMVEGADPEDVDENNLAFRAAYETSWDADVQFADNGKQELTDGIRGSYFYKASEWAGYRAQDGAPFSVTVDLGEIKSFEQVQVGVLESKTRSFPVTYPQNIKIEYSSDKTTWSVFAQEEIKEDGHGVKRFSFDSGAVNGRYVRLTFDFTNWLFLDDINVYAKAVPVSGGTNPDDGAEYNLARNSNYIISRQADYRNVPGILTDGIYGVTGSVYDTNWTGFKYSYENKSFNKMWMDFDLGELKSVSSVIVSSRRDANNGLVLPENVALWSSTDGSTWQKLADMNKPSLTGGAEAVQFAWNGADGGFNVKPDDSTMLYTRYIRVTFDIPESRSGCVYLDEVKILGKDGRCSSAGVASDTTGLYNVALSKPYTVYLDEKTSPEPDIDGKQLTDGIVGKVDGSDPAWVSFNVNYRPRGTYVSEEALRTIVIDLQDVKSITKVQTNVLSCEYSSLPWAMYVHTSMDGVNWTRLGMEYNTDLSTKGRFGFSWRGTHGLTGVKNGFTDSIPEEVPAVAARYVRVDVELLLINQLDEIEIMGYDGVIDGAAQYEGNKKFDGTGRDYLKAGEKTAGVQDMVLCYNGWYGYDSESNQEVGNWNAERYRPYLTYVDTNGKVQDTMFDAVCLLGLNSRYGRPLNTYVVDPLSGNLSQIEDWEWYLDKTFREGGDVDELNKAAKIASEELGDPNYKVKLTIMLPGADRMNDHFGPIDGRYFNLVSNEEDRNFVTDWWIQQVLEGMEKGDYEYIDFVGFYWLEELAGYWPNTTQWANNRVHELGYKTFWIPFFFANGYLWGDEMGFDAVAYQPNHFFKDPYDKDDAGLLGTRQIDRAAQAANYGNIGLEIEVDGNAFFDPAKYNQYLDYLNSAVNNGMDGKNAYRNWYQSVDTFSYSAVSEIKEFRNIYDYAYQLMKGTYTVKPYIKDFSDEPVDKDNIGSIGGGSGSGGGGSVTPKPDDKPDPETPPTGDDNYTWEETDDGYKLKDADGEYVTGWAKVSGKWYYLGADGIRATGWQKVDNKWYYLKSDGVMATGWLKLGNTWYFLNAGGVMQTGWLYNGGVWYYLYSWGGMANTSWVKVGNTWYYMRGNGAMMTGWLQQGNTWYYLKESGAMATGWNWVGSKCYYFNASGKMAANTTVGGYKVDASGAWVK
ncbi:DUF4855 domain-containing protein [Fumia xinanensis]|uniref:DUF4855 domain-containing protein n=1 Tax=Fumia xinanensis TaxID=2763659 RepID=A0A926E7X9_9FIRM|nr:DUF4855 domain-containing protein [Fumia xinanensis]MBC8560816.1 DUF4855 domain-containing protein [Fumia xinanensis]